MKSLLIKDLISIRAQARGILLVLALWLGISLVNGSGSFFAALSTVYVIMLPLTAISADENSRYERYALTMPISRTALALSRYVLGVLCGLGLAALGFAVCVALGEGVHASAVNCSAFFFLGLLFLSLLLPLAYKYGVEKARLGMVGFFVAVFLVFGYIFEWLGIDPAQLRAAAVLLPLLSAAAMAVSAAVSVGIYRRREF